jgi:hypothetical protein
MTGTIGWICCGLGAATGIAAALASVLALMEMRLVVCLIASAITFFGVGVHALLIPEIGRRGARAVQQAFEFGVDYCRATHAPPPHRDVRDDPA